MADVAAMLAAGIAAARSGDRERARTLLLEVVQTETQNEQAWLWLSSVVDSTQDVMIALENVLAINSQNQWAREALEIVRVKQVLETGQARMPTSTVQTPQTARRVGDYLVEQGYLTHEQLNQALDQQRQLASQGKQMPIGQILLRNHIISRDHLAQAFEAQFNAGGGTGRGAIGQLGEYLIRKGFVTWSQLAQVIALQADLAQQGHEVRLGELLVRNRLLTRDQLARVLEDQFQDYDSTFGGVRR